MAAGRLGFSVEEKILVSAKKRLAAHHGTPSSDPKPVKTEMNQWSNQVMMMPMQGSNQMMPMMVGGFGGFDNSSKGRKGKGGKGATADSGAGIKHKARAAS